MNAFQIHLDEQFPFLKGKRLILAVSGGVDSVVLCWLMHLSGIEFGLAHCNFHLRGTESDMDSAFVEDLAKQLGRPFHLKDFDTKASMDRQKGSVQMVARELRYAWFSSLLSSGNYDYLVTAHHLDDSLETFLINLSRGTGISGLTGIPAKNDRVVRPLLPFTKKEILDYARANDFMWREDQSNLQTEYLRNKIRNVIVPSLLELNPNFMGSFSTTLNNLKAARSILDGHLKRIAESVSAPCEPGLSCVKYHIPKLHALSPAAAYWYALFQPYGFTRPDELGSLLEAQSGKQLISDSHRLVKHGDHLLLGSLEDKPDTDETVEIPEGTKASNVNGITLLFKTFDVKGLETKELKSTGPESAYFDLDLLHFPLVVRKWKSGDYFYPLGLGGRKKLSDFFKDEKFSVFQKENIWLLCSGEDIIWVIGRRMDDRFKVSDKTKQIIHVALEV